MFVFALVILHVWNICMWSFALFKECHLKERRLEETIFYTQWQSLKFQRNNNHAPTIKLRLVHCRFIEVQPLRYTVFWCHSRILVHFGFRSSEVLMVEDRLEHLFTVSTLTQ